MKHFIGLLIAAIFLSSCSTSTDVVSNDYIQKRKYKKGYYVEKRNQTSKTEVVDIQEITDNKFTQREGENDNKHLTHSELVIENSDENSFVASTDPNLILPEEQRVLITQAFPNEDDLQDEMVSTNEENSSTSKANKNFQKLFSKHTSPLNSPNLEVFGLVSFISGLIGLIPFWGLLLGFISIITGIISLRKIAKNPGKFYGKGFAIAGIILGIIGIVISALIILAFLYGV